MVSPGDGGQNNKSYNLSRGLTVDNDVDLLANCLPVGDLHVVLAEPLEVASGALVRHPGGLLPIVRLLHVLLLHRLRHLEPGAAEGRLAMFWTYWYFETFLQTLGLDRALHSS